MTLKKAAEVGESDFRRFFSPAIYSVFRFFLWFFAVFIAFPDG